MKYLCTVFSLFSLSSALGEPATPLITSQSPDSVTVAIEQMVKSSNEFLNSLTPAQKAKATMEMKDENREAFKFTPGARKGIPLEELDDSQQSLAKKILATALSERGMLKASTIIQLEQLLSEMENNPKFRNSKAYYTTIFGTPAAGATWAWRFEGHHLVVNLTIVDGKTLFVAPTFMGASPAKVKDGRMKGTHVLEKEESIARSIAVALQKENKPVIYNTAAPQDILTAESRKIQQLEPAGIKASEMSDVQWQALLELVSEYAHRHRQAFAEQEMKKFQAIPRDQIYFAWAGSLEVAKAYYYRIQTPSILIEAANSQNNANHMHSVWRDAANDYGRDTLGEHYKHHQH